MNAVSVLEFKYLFLQSNFQKIAELNEIIDVRENKLMDLSMKNAELCESNSNLKR